MMNDMGKINLKWSQKHGGGIWGVYINKNGNPIYCSSFSGRLCRYDSTGKIVWDLNLGISLYRLDASDDGKFLCTGAKDKKIYFLSDSGEILWSYETGGSVLCVSLSSDAEIVFGASTDHNIYCLTKNGKALWRSNLKSAVRAVAVGTNKSFIVASSFNNLLTALDMRGNLLWYISTGKHPYRVMISPDSSMIIGGSEENKLVAISPSGSILWRTDLGSPINAIAFSPDGTTIYAGANGGDLFSISRNGKIKWKISINSPITSIDASDDYVVVGTADGIINLFEINKPIHEYLMRIERMIKESKRDDIEVEEMEHLLQSAKLLVNVGDSKKAESLLNEVEKELKKLHLIAKTMKIKFENYEEVFVNTLDDLKEGFRKINEWYNMSDFKGCIDAVNEMIKKTVSLRDILNDARKQDEVMKEIYIRVKKDMEESSSMGIDVSDAYALLKKANEEINNKNYAIALTYIRDVEKLIVSRKLKHREAMEILHPIKEIINTSSKYIDTSDFENMLSEAEDALEKNDYDRSREIADSILDMIESMKEDAVPTLSVKIGGSEGIAIDRSKIMVTLTNIGKAHATKISLNVVDSIALVNIEPDVIERLNAGEKKDVTIIATADRNDIPLDAYLNIKMKYKRAYDGKEYTSSKRARITIGPMVEDVFLMYKDGRLISHNTRRLRPNVDGDILSGMLTAVTAFVKDSFRDPEAEDLNELKYGKTKILIERGDYLCVAVVVSGVTSAKMTEMMRETIKSMEEKYGETLEKWDGTLASLKGINEMVERIISATYV